MSIVRYVETIKTPDLDLLYTYLKQNHQLLKAEKRSENLYYFWETSTSRGVDVSVMVENLIEVRNTICSNFDDYNLTNLILKLLNELFQGTFYIESTEKKLNEFEGKQFTRIDNPYLTFEEIREIQLEEASYVQKLIESSDECITLYGPKRKIHLGKSWLSKLKDTTPFGLVKAIEKTIFKVNNTDSNYEYGNVIEIGKEGNKKTIKLISNQVDVIIDKYDYIGFQVEEGIPIVILNNDLNTILPKKWKILDEYTIIAPILEDAEFEKLVRLAAPFNKEEEAFGKLS